MPSMTATWTTTGGPASAGSSASAARSRGGARTDRPSRSTCRWPSGRSTTIAASPASCVISRPGSGSRPRSRTPSGAQRRSWRASATAFTRSTATGASPTRTSAPWRSSGGRGRTCSAGPSSKPSRRSRGALFTATTVRSWPTGSRGSSRRCRPFSTGGSPSAPIPRLGAGSRFVFGDVSAQRAAEAALRASELRYRTLAQALPQLVWTCGADGRCDF